MKVILMQDVKSLGKKDEVVNVSDGYARNMLFPKKLAVEANAKAMNELKVRKTVEAKHAAELLAAAEALAAKLEGKKVTTGVKVGAGGRTFGSVSAKEIAEAIASQLGVEVDKKKMALPNPIKELGITPVTIRLHPQVTATVNVEVKEV
ncbi:MAG: 50S ribosomal protein L9 [Lachnospiraceae bacterium]|nr:50S ribosomal protein L9 [Lachnospiraceae bacterium]